MSASSEYLKQSLDLCEELSGPVWSLSLLEEECKEEALEEKKNGTR